MYEGLYKNGKRDGQGYYMWSDGDIYFGGYLNGEKHGVGIFYDSNERKVTNYEYEEGVLISSENRGFGGDQESEYSKFSKILGADIQLAEGISDSEVKEMSEVKIKW